MLKDQYDAGDFIEVTTKNFSKAYPSEDDKGVMWPYFKKTCEDFFKKPFDAKRARELNQISQAFLSKKIKEEYAEAFNSIEGFIRSHKLSSEQAKLFEVKVSGPYWLMYYKGVEIKKTERKNIPTILKTYLGLDVPVIVLSLTEQEREGIFQGLWGLYINQLKKP